MNHSRTGGDDRLYAIEQVPVLQNRLFDTAAEARNCLRGDVELRVDPATGIVTNTAFDPGRVSYDRSYNNEQSSSPAFGRHLDDVALLIRRQLGDRRLFEIGCGKGTFLERLAGYGCEIGGCDPTYEGSNPAVTQAFFSADAGIRRRQLILRHVLEHVADPVAFLRMLADVNGGGSIYIEVPCLDWIIDHCAWFDIFYEHVNYFRVDDFRRIFGRLQTHRLFGGQYMAIIADLATLRDPDAIRAQAEKEVPVSFPKAFGPPDPTDAEPGDVVWGAASKGVIYALVRERLGCPVSATVDVNPAKQLRYLPSTGVPILSPAMLVDRLPRGGRVMVMNSNYLAEIIAATGGRYRYEPIDHALG
jgi:hypothetical protein